ncbi:MAG: transcriptional regulator [Rhodobacteraceae bacterium CG17_big_fil_post_rev_8_21_14_2_50_63_15]|nr:winged helix-turn-helix transcriptional regulator [Roseovarius sp.]PIV79184.1 MAG: transcriptional regulator [Rhodobacteraceae bacterium CG17_big_fil_post_rev_8_21_14_2_50_63_15]
MFDKSTPEMTPVLDAEQVSAIAKALAHPARVRIISFLLSRPGCIGGAIVEEVGLAQSTVSEHLRILKEAGIVTGTIDYPRICYALDPSAIMPLSALCDAIAARSSAGSETPCCYTPQGCISEEKAR